MSEQKIEQKSIKIFPLEKVESPTTKVESIVDVKALLLNFNSEIRTSKSIKVTNDGRLKPPVFSADPVVCEIGEIAYIGGTMKVCSDANTWSNI